ncbi:hypothetical protein EJ04DRAFT_495070 [Polyplosphaeria fusca]|uniref:DUF2423 domain-containing protein n=1 Tax=Polyplosphaeria fusca TaxID=682080 RepID=A0A9P4QTB3_9PLEO|nr:hypothetical protein EJ04DRAFT_495070 [Polyplosphaeria fusca]
MAKSARASTNKVNKSKLRKKVFGPIEHARLLRSSEKLMDIALNHPKPDRPKKNDMEVESTEESKEDEYPKGKLLFPAAIPASLHSTSNPTHPKAIADDQRECCAFFHCLGLSDHMGLFADKNGLKFALDVPIDWSNMDVDGDASASAPLKRKRTDTKHKSKHSRRRKPRNQISFPQFRGKGALKPHGEHRVKKQR